MYQEQIKEMTKKHGIIIVHSAGNYGPVYSSVSRNTFILQNIFLIGAISMKKEGGEDNQISYKISRYSSRGPNQFGERGVCFVAPGEIRIEMPEYYSEKVSIHTGTSYAAPNVAGSIACLLSALKANSIKYLPTTIKFVLSKTAFLPPKGNVLAYGHGIIQINAAFEFIKHSDFLTQYEFRSCRAKIMKEEKNGIFLKVRENLAAQKYSIEILNKPKGDKVKLQVTPGAEKFVQFFDLQNHTFKVKLDPAKLKPGTINYAEIYGFNSNNSIHEAMFHLPITVLLPEIVTKDDNYRIQKNITIKPHVPYRFFIIAPEKSRQCSVKITALEKIATQLFLRFAIEDVRINRNDAKWYAFDKTNKIQTHYLKAYSDKIHEISLTLPSWTTKAVKFEVEIDFYGIYSKEEEPKNENKIIEKHENVITIVNELQLFTAALSIEFKKISYNLIPEYASIEKVKNICDSDFTEYLKLLYTFEILKETKCFFTMYHKEKFPLLRAQIFTESKKFVLGLFSSNENNPIILSPGKYQIIAYVFYSPSSKNAAALPGMKELPYILCGMEFFQTFSPMIFGDSTMIKESKYTKEKLIEFKNNEEHKIYFKEIPSEKLPSPLPKNATFHGSLNFSDKKGFQLNVDFEHKCVVYQKQAVNNNNNVVKQKENVKPSKKKSAKSKKAKKLEIKNEISEEIIPLKFKENFGIELTNFFTTMEYSNPSNNEKVDQTKTNNLKKAREYVIKVCDLFIANVENGNILKELAQIKHALTFENLGTALLHLNKISTKNQTNPAFKFIDLAIIELLKHLKCDHLVEAHQHTLLDRHRDYYRLL